MALIELKHFKPDAGKSYDCASCPVRIQKLRRCREDREFTYRDGAMWPMQIRAGGQLYGFCPGKATWDLGALDAYTMLVVAAETGSLLYNGGIANQPRWFMDHLAWFIPIYDQVKFITKAEMVLGDGKKAGQHGGNRSHNQAKRR